MHDAAMTLPDSTAVDEALAALEAAQAQMDAARDVVAARTRDLADQVTLLGMSLRSTDAQADVGLIRRLYWDAPSLATQVVSEAFGLRAPSDVFRIARAATRNVPCRGCGLSREFQVKNRTHLTSLRSTLCEDCSARAQEQERQRKADLEVTWRRQSQMEADYLDQAMIDYVLAHPDMPEEPDGEAFYVDVGGTAWGTSTVRLRDLNAVRRQLLRSAPES